MDLGRGKLPLIEDRQHGAAHISRGTDNGDLVAHGVALQLRLSRTTGRAACHIAHLPEESTGSMAESVDTALHRAGTQHGGKAFADGLLANLGVDFLARQIGNVEHVDRLLAVSRDVRRRDIEVEIGQRAGQFV